MLAMAWWLRALVVGGVILAAAGCGSSGDDDSGTAGTGGSSTVTNVYISSIRVTPGTPNCLPRPLTVSTDGTIAAGCSLIEARATAPDCSCDTAHGRVLLPTGSPVPASTREFLHNESACDQTGQAACADFCFCALVEFSGNEQHVCQTSVADPGTQYGFCYLDDQYDLNGDGTPDVTPELLAACPASSKRTLRFMGAGVPAPDAMLFVACLGVAVQ